MVGSEIAADLTDAANGAVDRLRGRGEPGELPERDEGWNEAFIGAIRRLKENFRSSPDLPALLEIASRLLYGREIHWAMELVQNAEDAGAKAIVFVFEPGRVVVFNDGEPFTARDVWGICSAGHSPKKNKIGFFGIGFKSVHQITDNPEVHSGPYAFRLEDKIYPEPLRRTRRSWSGARFILPIREDARDVAARALESLAGPDFTSILLTLRDLEQIRVVDARGSENAAVFRRRQLVQDDTSDDCEIVVTAKQNSRSRWRRYYLETGPVPPGVSRSGREFGPGDTTTVLLARPLDRPVEPTPLHVFLPLDVNSELRWLVQADLEPTPGRERAAETDWNRWLFGEIGDAIARAVEREAQRGPTPWDLVPLGEEVSQPLQQIAFQRATRALTQRRFVRSARRYVAPTEIAFPAVDGIRKVIRDSDLRALSNGPRVYPAQGEFEMSPQRDRASRVLIEQGSLAVACDQIVELLRLPDSKLYSTRRDHAWWLALLNIMASHASDSELDAMAETRCIPVHGGRRVRPSPNIALGGYLVAFSRGENLEDLQSFFSASELLIVDLPQARARRGRGDAAVAAMVEKARILLTRDERFHVAMEAGPYHVVNDLCLPRMEAFGELDALTPSQVEQLWRMVEYCRQKWHSYVSEYRRFKTQRALEEQVAEGVASRLRVVGAVHQEGHVLKRAVPVRDAYISSDLLGWNGMDTALKGLPNLLVMDPIHARAVRRQGRPRRAPRTPPSHLEFLRLMRAPIGPIVERSPEDEWEGITYVAREETPWVNWDSQGDWTRWRPLGLRYDWSSQAISWLASRWDSLREPDRRRRGRALWDSIQADWQRLAPTVESSAVYKYYSWIQIERTRSSWVGQLGAISWLVAADGTLRKPSELAIAGDLNQRALGGDPSRIVAWPVQDSEAAAGLGVHLFPPPAMVMDTLASLRAEELEASSGDRMRIASACYALLARAIREAGEGDRDDLLKVIRKRLEGNHRVGLIYAPPPSGMEGRSWWPPSKLVQGDVAETAGPFVGQLARRYQPAGALWTALGVATTLTPRIVLNVIQWDMSGREPDGLMTEYYGRLVGHLEGLIDVERGELQREVAVLTTNGWRSSGDAWWTSRIDARDAFANAVHWWLPGSRDPSTLRNVAAWFGVREARATRLGGSMSEAVHAQDPNEPEIGDESAWRQAVTSWPSVLRSQAPEPFGSVLPEVWAQIGVLRPMLSPEITIAFELDSSEVRGGTQAQVAISGSHLVAVSRNALFSRAAAELIADNLPENRWFAASHLRGLLADALTDPDEFERQRARHASDGEMPQAAVFEHLDETEELGEVKRATGNSRPPPQAEPVRPAPPAPFAEPLGFELVEFMSSDGLVSATPKRRAAILKPPVRGSKKNGDADQSQQPQPRQQFNQFDTEIAARPWVEQFEEQRGGFRIERQPPGVGADYRSSDGRYIEIKAFSGTAPDEVSLTQLEWRAARHPQLRENYWLYVVEGLRTEPVVTAVFNPVLDDSVLTEPKGDVSVRGWRRARRRWTARFARRVDSETGPTG